MLRQTSVKAAAALLFALSPSPFCGPLAQTAAVAADGLTITTKQGQVRGAAADGIRTFKGIPYAAPPVGPLRWKAPRPPVKWEGVRDATKFGSPCPGFDGRKMTPESRPFPSDIYVNVPAAPGGSEDCLHLNIWAPVDAKTAAVMVWIQPLGAASMPLFDGASLASHGVVMVTMDYRPLTLGNFAHPALTREAQPDEPLSRFQTMDQIAALRWVKQNIAAFGGDPDNVTVFGLSAGAASTLQLLTIPDAKGLVDTAIVQSGVGRWTPFTLPQMEQIGSWAATQAGLPGKDATAEQLRALPVDKLPWLGLYSVDGRLQPENGTTAIAEGRMADVPLLIGWTDFDGSSLRGASAETITERAPDSVKAAYANEGKTGADLGYQMYTDQHVGAPARWIADKASRGAPSYLYLFSYVRTANRGKVRGAAHGDDMSFVFGNWGKAYPQLALSDEDRAATRMMQSCWTSFAKTGKPHCDGAPGWPRYSRADDRLMDLGLKPEVRQGFRAQQLDAQEAARHEDADRATRNGEDLITRLSETATK
jgi:para-nitrobenzyl esterase